MHDDDTYQWYIEKREKTQKAMTDDASMEMEPSDIESHQISKATPLVRYATDLQQNKWSSIEVQ